jgi:hypothetical protein
MPLLLRWVKISDAAPATQFLFKYRLISVKNNQSKSVTVS